MFVLSNLFFFENDKKGAVYAVEALRGKMKGEGI